jgi:hypothetical protein
MNTKLQVILLACLIGGCEQATPTDDPITQYAKQQQDREYRLSACRGYLYQTEKPEPGMYPGEMKQIISDTCNRVVDTPQSTDNPYGKP